MARPLRFVRANRRYHVAARGREQEPIYRQDSDRAHFLELLAEGAERFDLRVRACVLMDYATVGQAVRRFGLRLEKAHNLRRQLSKIEKILSNVES